MKIMGKPHHQMYYIVEDDRGYHVRQNKPSGNDPMVELRGVYYGSYESAIEHRDKLEALAHKRDNLILKSVAICAAAIIAILSYGYFHG